MKHCSWCDTNKEDSEFYVRRARNNSLTFYCKLCTVAQTLIRTRKRKQELVDYKGGKCQRCGFSGCQAAFDFHHPDRKTKELEISKFKAGLKNPKIKAEVDKCLLLCSNCHRTIHFEEQIVRDRIV